MRTYGPKKIIVNEQAKNVMPLSESSLNQMLEHGKTGMIIISSSRSAIESTDPELDLTEEFEKDMEEVGGVQSIDSDALYDVMEEWLRKRNSRCDKELEKDIRSAGFSFTPIYGGYKGAEDVKDSYEPSYVVYCYNRDGGLVKFDYLEQFGLDMCRKYKQESVLIQRPGEPPAYYDADGNKVDMSGEDDVSFKDDNASRKYGNPDNPLLDKVKINNASERFFSTISRDKTNPKKFTLGISEQRTGREIIFEDLYIQLRPASYNEKMRRTKSGEYIL
jgi:hypothetical protein